MNTQTRNTFLLVTAAIIWGGGFVAQSIGADFVGPFTFLALRSYLGGLALIPLLWIMKVKVDKKTVQSGIKLGLWLFLASFFQQWGVAYTTTAKAGFITTLYVVLVPIISWLLFHKKASLKVWFCVLLSITGLYLLNHAELSLALGDSLVMISAFLYCGHILAIDHMDSTVNPVAASSVQFFTTALCATLGMILFEDATWASIALASRSILYAGLVSSGMGYTLQTVGQRGVNPTIASIALSLESAFAAIFGWLLLSQALNTQELIGCLLMFASIIISQF